MMTVLSELLHKVGDLLHAAADEVEKAVGVAPSPVATPVPEQPASEPVASPAEEVVAPQPTEGVPAQETPVVADVGTPSATLPQTPPPPPE